MRKNKCAAEHIHIRVTEDEKNRITDAARDAGMTVSELPEDLAPTQMLSISSLIMPSVTQDDSKRQNLELTEPYTGNSVRA